MMAARMPEHAAPLTDKLWRVALTEPNGERRAAVCLLARKYQVYYPTITAQVSRGRGQQRKIERAMFPRYLFVRMGDATTWERLYSAAGIVGSSQDGSRRGLMMKPLGGFVELSHTIIEAIVDTESRKRGELNTVAKRMGFKVGDPVSVKLNPFTELLATIDELDDDERVVILVSLMGCESRVTVKAQQLAPSE